MSDLHFLVYRMQAMAVSVAAKEASIQVSGLHFLVYRMLAAVELVEEKKASQTYPA